MCNKEQLNEITIQCNNETLDFFQEFLKQLNQLSSMGCSRNIIVDWNDEEKEIIEFDGDGCHRITKLEINKDIVVYESILSKCPSCGDSYDPEVGMDDRCLDGQC